MVTCCATALENAKSITPMLITITRNATTYGVFKGRSPRLHVPAARAYGPSSEDRRIYLPKPPAGPGRGLEALSSRVYPVLRKCRLAAKAAATKSEVY